MIKSETEQWIMIRSPLEDEGFPDISRAAQLEQGRGWRERKIGSWIS